LKLRKSKYNAFISLLNKHFTEDEIDKHKLKIKLMETFDIEVPKTISAQLAKGK